MPDIPIQRAILKYHNNIETLIIEATLDGEGDSFGWIIPVPSIPQRFEKVSPGLLKTLSLRTEPEFIHSGKISIAFLLFAFGFLLILFLFGRKSALIYFLLLVFVHIAQLFYLPYFGGPSGQTFGIMQVSRQIIGNYETFVLKATKVADLNTWLKDNGFRKFPEKANPIIDDYIDKKWCFVAAKLIRKNEEISTPHPILIEFEADRPVYPMRLTALSGSTLYLELFVLAAKEAVPNNYKLRKEYCNIFHSSLIEPEKDILLERQYTAKPYLDKTKTHKRFIAVKKFKRVGLSWWSEDEIAHQDADKVMWDSCVLTKLAGKISSRKMNEDMYFNFEKTSIFLSAMYTMGGAIKHGLQYALIVLNVGLLIMWLFGRFIYTLKANLDKKVVNRKKQLTHFLVLFLISLMALAVTYVSDGEKATVVKLSSAISEWKNFSGLMFANFYDLSCNEKCTDVEIMEQFKRYSDIYYNPFTKGPVIIEDSPGNISIERNYGNIIAIKSYWKDGTPILLFDYKKGS